MISKTMSASAIRSRSLHDAFICMLDAAIRDGKFDAGEIIKRYWSYAFREPLTEEDFNDSLIDRIRMQLLKNAGAVNVNLKDTQTIKKIKSNLIFSEE